MEVKRDVRAWKVFFGDDGISQFFFFSWIIYCLASVGSSCCFI
jgi:hypothetical protein